MHKNDTIITVSKLYYALRLIHVFAGVTEKAKTLNPDTEQEHSSSLVQNQ